MIVLYLTVSVKFILILRANHLVYKITKILKSLKDYYIVFYNYFYLSQKYNNWISFISTTAFKIVFQ